MSLIEETKPKLSSEAIQSMCRIDVDAHKHIEWVTEMFIKGGGKIQQVPMGATALKLDIPQSVQKSIDRSQGKGAAAGGQANKLRSKLQTDITHIDSSVKRNKTKAISGYQNLISRSNGKYAVIIDNSHQGVFELEEAIKVRDAYRVKHNLPKVEY